MNDPSFTASESAANARPDAAVESLFTIFEPYANLFTLEKGQLITYQEMVGFIFLFREGRISLIRDEDSLYLAHTTQKSIFGIVNHFHPLHHYSYRADIESHFGCIPIPLAFEMVNKHQMWLSLMQIISYQFSNIISRDNRLTGHDSYTIIRNIILELMQLPESVRKQLPLASYIIKQTKLSRSNVMRILRDLKEGDYIDTQRGILINAKKLPEKY
ncbi:helix-turn-helix domain-containing protein [Atlantibacter sp.]|uniref:helix-turn-helix domain-containing protein n=1 Tax=Atlantibacter sp. TaxID=1903473 RepID=UPI0028A68C1D|nr:helix-turn-helix domain-containing protein [Atlantibacter sp.]